MYCDKYKKSCEEAIAFNCNVPSNSINIEEQIQECKNCVFCEEKNEE